MTYFEMMDEIEVVGQLEYLSHPDVWMNDHKRLIEEARRKLIYTEDKEKRQRILAEIQWREEEIQLLKQKLAS
jgi:hypothetical protein